MGALIPIGALDGYWLWLTSSDGAVNDVAAGEILGRGGVFSAIGENRGVFEQVRVNPRAYRSGAGGRSSCKVVPSASTSGSAPFRALRKS
jgi:hypothetical protein